MSAKVSQLPSPSLFQYEPTAENPSVINRTRTESPIETSRCGCFERIKKYFCQHIQQPPIENGRVTTPQPTAVKEIFVIKVNPEIVKTCHATQTKIDALCIFHHRNPSADEVAKIGDSIDFLQRLEINWLRHVEHREPAWKPQRTRLPQNASSETS